MKGSRKPRLVLSRRSRPQCPGSGESVSLQTAQWTGSMDSRSQSAFDDELQFHRSREIRNGPLTGSRNPLRRKNKNFFLLGSDLVTSPGLHSPVAVMRAR